MSDVLMNQEKLKLIVHNLELLVQSLKEEISDKTDPSVNVELNDSILPYEEDYDEVFSG